MKVTYNWLKEFVDFDLSPTALADLLTMLGLEVEGIEQVGGGLDQVVVARVVEKNQHPNADKLSLCKVDNGTEILDVVCGAQNFKQGDTVALAQIGAVLPGDFKIKRSKIRGEESCGMLCSEKELHLADESAGIMLLSPDLTLGVPLFDALGLKDTIFEIGLTPNRADCLSVIGIAREIAAKLGTTLKHQAMAVPEGSQQASQRVGVTIQDPVGCPRYAARYISGCTIAPSPAWLVNRLQAVGVRSINNVVDITNLVMMELGHPLHAFDYRQVAGGQIVVRKAGEGERFTTLDGQERILTASDVVICDKERAVALAGIMGGLNSEIKDDSRDILLESAFFDPPTIRRTGKRLGLHTESSHRFERGADIGMVPLALDRAATLMAELAGGTVAAGRVDAYPSPKQPVSICFRPQRCNDMIGIQLTSERMAELFRNLAFTVATNTDGSLQVGIPSWRIDIEREIDLIEEICRLNGFDQVPASMPVAAVISDRPSRHQQLQRLVRDHFVAEGMNEIVTFSFIGPDGADKLGLSGDDPRRSGIRLCNPLAEEQSVMRTTLLPGLLETASRNMSFRSLDLRLFEMRRIYMPTADAELPHEPIWATGLISGARFAESWCQQQAEADFFDAKAVLENLFEKLQLDGIRWSAEQPEPYYHPGKACRILCGTTLIGTLGELHPAVQGRYELERPAYCFELDFEALVRLSGKRRAIVPPSRYPDSVRDLALLAPLELASEQLLSCVSGLRLKELEDVNVFDLYQGQAIPSGQKSIALRLRYRSPERTLTDDEVSALHQKVVDTLAKKLGVALR
ncbi:MAG: phenylalanine--tRNA ligase subunit beta [Geobacter sp.]